MAKYIDVEPLMNGGWQLQRYNSGNGYVNQEHASLKDIPPADVRPVVRSHWKKNDNGTYSCERCHSWIPEEQRHYANWCLYCSADMRSGDADGEEKD